MCSAANLQGKGVSPGLFSSPKGAGFSIDYEVSRNIRNSYIVLADLYGVVKGRYDTPGIKAVFLHYNRFAGFESGGTAVDFYFAPGVSMGYVRDSGSEGLYGISTAVDIALAGRINFERGFDIEVGFNCEAGLFSRSIDKGVRMSLYRNGLTQAYYPFVKISYRF